MESPSGFKKGSLLLPLGVDMHVQREGCFLRPLCLHRAEGVKVLVVLQSLHVAQKG